MSSDKLCLAFVCLAVAICLMPSVKAVSTGLLSVLADKSICQSVVDYDINPDRIPRVIKIVKCAEKPDRMCPARSGDGGSTSCCKQNTDNKYKFSCQEVIDSVMVTDIKGVPSPQTVPVGCACVMQESVTAEEVD